MSRFPKCGPIDGYLEEIIAAPGTPLSTDFCLRRADFRWSRAGSTSFDAGEHAPAPLRIRLLFRRLFIFAGTALLTIAGGYEMYDVVKVGGVTVLEAILLAFFLALLAWVAFSFMSAMAGFSCWSFRLKTRLLIDRDLPFPKSSPRIAMLLPTYNEDPHDLMARLRAMYESVASTAHQDQFDWFLLSDTTDPDIWIREERDFVALRRQCDAGRFYYRHRSDNTPEIRHLSVGEGFARLRQNSDLDG